MPAPHLIRLSQITRSETEVTGREAESLAELINANLPIIDGLCLTHAAFNYYLDHHQLRPKIERLIKKVEPTDLKQAQELSHQISQLFKQHPLPEGLTQHLQTQINQLITDQSALTVRSISDLPDHHFYQRDYVTDHSAHNIQNCINQAWQRYFSPHLLIHRHELGYNHTGPGVSILIQPNLPSQASGMAFKHLQKKNIIIVEAIRGPRFRDLLNQVTPDYYEVNVSTSQVEYQSISTQLHSYDSHANKLEPLSQSAQSAPKLEHDQLIQLAKQIKKAAAVLAYAAQFNWVTTPDIRLIMTRPMEQTTHTLRLYNTYQLHHADYDQPLASGQILSPGAIVGRIQKITQPSDWDHITRGDLIVASNIELSQVDYLRKAGGLILTQIGHTSNGAILARELGIPAISVNQHHAGLLRNNQIVSLDARHGYLYRGKKALKPSTVKLPSYVTSIDTISTKTNVMVDTSEVGLAEHLAAKQVDGIAVIRGELIAANILGSHPRLLLQSGRRSLYIHNLIEQLTSMAMPFEDRLVLFQLSDWSSLQLNQLEGGQHLEPTESNPALGYRGTDRLLQEPDLLALDLEAYKYVRQSLTNLQLVIPRIQTVEQYKSIKKLLYHYGVKRTPNLHFYLQIIAPSSVIQISDLINSGLDGLVIPVESLASHLLSTDLTNFRHSHRIEEAKQLVVDTLSQITSHTKKAQIPVIITGGWLNTDPDFVQKCIKAGVTGISVSPQMYDQIKVNVYRNEINLAKNKHRRTKKNK